MNFEIKILGTSSAVPVRNRFPSAQFVNIYGKRLLIDCGEGTQFRLRDAKVSFGSIRYIFISHLHGDHYYGLFGLLSTYALLHRTMPLDIFAPAFLEEMLRSKYSPVNLKDLPYQINFHHHPKNGGIILDEKNFIVETIPLKHSIDTWGFIIREKKRPPNILKEAIEKFKLLIEEIVQLKNGKTIIRNNGQIIRPNEVLIDSPPPRSYAYISDTQFYPEIVEKIKNVTILYHEATFSSDDEQRAIMVKHSTAAQAAQIAKLANVEKLIIGHFSPTIKNFNKLLEEAKAIFPNTELAYDGMYINILYKSRKKFSLSH